MENLSEQDQIKTIIALITPEKSQEILSRQHKNRTLRKSVVSSYARDMLNDRWMLNGETIKISEKGELIDGQHRLSAIITAGIPIKMMVTYNIPEESFRTIDNGKKRTIGDILTIEGYSYGDNLGATLRYLYYWDDIKKGKTITFHQFRKTPTKEELLELLKNNEDLFFSAQHAYFIKNLIPPSAAIFCHYILTKIDKNKAMFFFERLKDGTGLEKGDPIHTLRERFIASRKSRYERLTTEICIIFMFIAWNYFRKNKSLIYLKWTGKKFPLPI